ncbi:MAG: FtsX-like permease family protein [Chloroflexi bacterium]|nr:FtsX-like permease family protein [Chloroflexota bacterium]
MNHRLPPRVRKVLADLWANRTRSILVISSIAVGVFAIGAIMTTYAIYNEDMTVSYAAAQPANIEILTDSFDDELIKAVAAIPGVAHAEGRHMVTVRVSKDGGAWKRLDIVANKEPMASRINLLTPMDGAIYPGDRELIVRQDPMNDTGLVVGDTALIQIDGGSIREMPVVGVAGDQFAAGDFAAPPRGYTTLDTVDWLGSREDYNRLYVQVEDGNDEAAIADVAALVEDKLERLGRPIFRTNSSLATEHPMGKTALAMLGVLAALGVLVTLLSSSLIVNTLNALFTQHRRQVGVMKLVGARSIQISVMYIALIIAYGLIALAVAIPLSMVAGYGLAAVMADLMSIELRGFRVIPSVIIAQGVIALGAPLFAGYFPITKGTKTTVRRAISDEGPGESSEGLGLLDKLGAWLKWVSRPLLLSIRNTFRRKGRLALTLFTLIIAGAIFIAVFNVRDSLHGFMDILGQHFMADVTVTFDQPYRAERVGRDILQVPGVKAVEGWGFTPAEIMDEDDELITNLLFSAPPAGSTLLEADMLAGRWLLPEDEKVLVISDSIWNDYPDLQPGDSIRVKIQGHETEEWPVVGVFRFTDMIGDSLGYANYETISRLTTTMGQAALYKVVTGIEVLEEQRAVSKALDESLRERGYKVGNVEAGLVTRQQQVQPMNILVTFLLTMALLTAVVGSIGLTGTMGMNVLERTREIGVMRAIGAVDGEIIKSVVIEGMLIGLISWAAGAILSFPISYALLSIIGSAMIDDVIPMQITLDGFLIWLGVVVLLSVGASMLPARSAARLTIREVLAYE